MGDEEGLRYKERGTVVVGFRPGFMRATWEVWTDHVHGECGGSWSLPPETAVLTGMGAAGGTEPLGC
eukprot:SAG31_NODE_3259_length_4484_cov_2.910376_2_plen_67_part_00